MILHILCVIDEKYFFNILTFADLSADFGTKKKVHTTSIMNSKLAILSLKRL